MYKKFSLKRWLTTTNHKDIGILYLVAAVFFLLVGGLIAELMRAQLATPNGNVLSATVYPEAVTLHGLIMILWMIPGFGSALANYFVPLQIGSKDMAFPRLNSLGYWLYLFSGILLISTILLPGGGPNIGWTLYAPLNTSLRTPQIGMTLAVLALGMLSTSFMMGSVNIITTIARIRTKGVTLWRMPSFSWAVLFTQILALFAFPALVVGLVLLTTDRVFSTVFFSSIQGGAILWDQLFWFFGHPEVYIVAFPALGVLAEVIVAFARRPLFAKKIFIAEFALTTALSTYVWVHHMFLTTINFNAKTAFSITTFAISVPFEGLILGLILTLRKSAIKLTTPMLYALGAIFFIIFGGITGIFQGSVPLDYAFNGTYWVVGHFHYMIAGGSLFGLIAGLYYYFPRITKKMYNEKVGKIIFIVSFAGFNVLYFPYFLLTEMPRRIGTYALDPQWWPLNLTATVGAIIFGPAILLALVNLFYSYRKGKSCESNPWNSCSPEWTGKFESPSSTETEFGQPQSSSLTDDPPPSETSANTSEVPSEEHEGTLLPIIIAAGASLFIFGFVVFLPLLFVGLAVIALAILKWFKDGLDEKHAEKKEEPDGEKWPFQSVSKEKFGMWVFLVSDVVLFGCLITSYIYVRVMSSTWPIALQTHNLTIGVAETLILVTSSFCMILALQAVRNGNQQGLKAGLVGAFALGFSFLVLKLGVEWPQEIAKSFVISGGLAPSSYFDLMGAHALHLGIGLVALAYLIVRAFSGKFTANSHSSVELIGLYWTFVDIVWLFLFPLFYLI